MKIVERVVMVLMALVFIGGVAWVYFAVQHKEQEVRDAVARGEYEIHPGEEETVTGNIDKKDDSWKAYYSDLIPITIGTVTMQASVADSIPERIKGLSDTPFLPDSVVKLFAFGVEGEHSIWMKDMNYPIDVIWVDKGGKIVHYNENISPDTYPKSFSSPVPAWYVIEANAGFVASSSLKRGDEVVVPVFKSE